MKSNLMETKLHSKADADAASASNVITRSIISGRLDSIVREMGIITMRTARSSIIYSGRDFSCALMDRRGQLLAVGTSVPLHIFPLIAQVQYIIDKYGDETYQGDVFIANDPYQGGTHLPDVAIIVPIFFDDQLIGYALNRAHWTDVGGMTPGSISSDARSIFQEGLRIPAVKLEERGVPIRQVYDLIASNVRVPVDVLGDMRAQIASCRGAGERFKSLFAKYSAEVVARHLDAILDDAEVRMRNRIRQLGNCFELYYEDYLDPDGVVDEARKICVRLKPHGDEMVVDFGGTARASQGPNNSSYALGICYAFIALKSVLDSEGQVNHGSFRPIKVVLPEGTFLSAVPPSPTGGMAEVGFAVLAVFGALADIAGKDVSAGETTAASHNFYGAYDRRFGQERYVVHYDYQAAGGGARASKDGLDVTRCIRSGSVQASSIEVIEQRIPVVYRRYELRTGSPGIGRFRGGHGVIRSYEVRQPGQFAGVLDNCVVPPFGIFKGHAGQIGLWFVHRGNQSFALTSVKNRLDLLPGDLIDLRTQGGGGYGDPLERDVSLVLSDVQNDLLSIEDAARLYGVVVHSDGTGIDQTATGDLRRELRVRRVRVTLAQGGAPIHRLGIRVACIRPGWGGLQRDDFIELHCDRQAAPLRFIVDIDDQIAPGVVRVDQEVFDRLQDKASDEFELRKLFSWASAESRGGWTKDSKHGVLG